MVGNACHISTVAVQKPHVWKVIAVFVSCLSSGVVGGRPAAHKVKLCHASTAANGKRPPDLKVA